MPGIAVVFAGQGAQAVGMGRDLAAADAGCAALFARADEVLGFRLSALCAEGPIEELTRSSNCQPAIFTVSAICYAALRKRVASLDPVGVAGLSLGEWTALYAAGVVSFDDALRVLQARGRFMQEACEEREGAMASVIGLDLPALEGVAARAGVWIANLNSPDQTVLSGERARIEEAVRLAKEAGAKRVIPLQVAGAFHSPLMASAASRFEAFLAGVTLREPGLPVLSNVTGAPHGDAAGIRAAMVRQVTGSVRWQSCVEWFKGRGADTYVECGPGKVLTGLVRRLDAAATLLNVPDAAGLEAAAAAMNAGPR